MTLSKPETGERFGHTGWASPLTYVGALSDGRWVLESDDLNARLEETSAHLNPNFGVLFDEMLGSRVDKLAREPEDLETLVEAVTLYHMIIEGMLALTGQHFIISYNEEIGTLPGNERSQRTPASPPRRGVS